MFRGLPGYGLGTEQTDRKVNHFFAGCSVLQVGDHIIQLDLEPAGLFAGILTGNNAAFLKPFCFPFREMANAVKLIQGDDGRIEVPQIGKIRNHGRAPPFQVFKASSFAHCFFG